MSAPSSPRRDRATAVRLQRAAADEGVGALGRGLAHEELQLADLVPRFEQAGQVIPLEVQLDAELAGEAVELEDRRRTERERVTRRPWHAVMVARALPGLRVRGVGRGPRSPPGPAKQ